MEPPLTASQTIHDLAVLPPLSTANLNLVRSHGLLNPQISEWLAYLNTDDALNTGVPVSRLLSAARKLSMIMCSPEAVDKTLAPLLKASIVRKIESPHNETKYKLVKQWPFHMRMEPNANTLIVGNLPINMPPILQKMSHVDHFFQSPGGSDPVQFWRKFHQLVPGFERIHTPEFRKVKRSLELKFKSLTNGESFPSPVDSESNLDSALLGILGFETGDGPTSGAPEEEAKGTSRLVSKPLVFRVHVLR